MPPAVRRSANMNDQERLEIKVPVPWSGQPVRIVCTGWRCTVIVVSIAALTAAILMYG
jgi:hypothetical protein